MKTISVLHLGGTLASSVNYKTGGVSPKYTAKDILNLYPEIKSLAKIHSRLIANMASENMNFQHYNLIAKEIKKEIQKDIDGIIITHGTDTLHYTSSALSFILEDLPIPVILVGSQRSSDRGSSDATLNLLSAVNFISRSDFAEVAICMHTTTEDTSCSILPGTKSRKFHTSRRDAFKPINTTAIALVYPDKGIDFLKKNYKKLDKKRKLTLKLLNPDLKIGILKSHPNLSVEELNFFKHYDGLIIEGTGLGHLPIEKTDSFTNENQKILNELKTLAKTMPLILTSQCIFGRLNMNVYSPGRTLQKIGILGNLLDLTTETAFIKLAWLLSNYKKSEVKALISENFRGEISDRTTAEFLEESLTTKGGEKWTR